MPAHANPRAVVWRPGSPAGVNARIDISKDGTMSVIPVAEPPPVSDADEIIARLP